jgi:hypothetical protein
MKTRKIIGIFIIVFAISWSHAKADVAGALTFGVFLNQLTEKVGGLIDKAANDGEVLEMGAGAQINNAIAQAKKAYADSLDITTDRLTGQQKKIFDDLTTEVDYLNDHVVSQLQKIVDQGSTVANELPWSKTFPQLTRFSPSYIMPIREDDLPVELHGNFFDAARNGFTPYLIIGGVTNNGPAVSTTMDLRFTFPYGAFHKSLYVPSSNSLTHVTANSLFLIVRVAI